MPDISTEILNIKGPTHLLEVLSLTNQLNLGVRSSRLVWLSAERELMSITSAQDLAEHPFVIQIETYPAAFPADFSPDTRLSTKSHLLDVLLITDSAWKSAICENADCCPLAGRPLPKGSNEPIQTQFNRLIAQTESEGYIQSESIMWLENLRLRDAWLVYIVAEPKNMDSKINQWINILDATPSLAISHILLTLRGILSYLQNDRLEAIGWIQRAIEAAPDYRLAALVNRALENDAPLELVLDSFRAVTYEKLKLKPPQAA